MDTTISYNTTTGGGPSTGGYTCVGCGTWVNFGTAHTCYQPPTYAPFGATQILAALTRIEQTLNAIAARLEKLTANQENTTTDE